MDLPFSYDALFEVRTETGFNDLACRLFHHQYRVNPVYREFTEHLAIAPQKVEHYTQIPFLPVSFFKSHQVISGNCTAQTIFYSSGTVGSTLSQHHIADLALYDRSLLAGFEQAFGPVTDYSLFALLPSYHQNKNASLLYMVDRLITRSGNPGGFYLSNTDQLIGDLKNCTKKAMLIGVSYALLDLAELKPDLAGVTIIETGGMKGRRKEMTKEDLHRTLCKAFNTHAMGSEYGMTELLSQAWSKKDGLFSTPPWMKILTRDTTDPLSLVENKTGGINIIDLANMHSCAFIATQDLGRLNGPEFQVLGRFDNADLRGCNLLVQ